MSDQKPMTWKGIKGILRSLVSFGAKEQSIAINKNTAWKDRPDFEKTKHLYESFKAASEIASEKMRAEASRAEPPQ